MEPRNRTKKRKNTKKMSIEVTPDIVIVDPSGSQDSLDDQSRKKRKRFSFEEKKNILEATNQYPQDVICEKYEISDRTLRKWKSEKEKIIKEAKKNYSKKLKKTSNAGKMDDAMFQWLVETRKQGIPISGPMIRRQALIVNKNHPGNDQFKASEGWLSGFKKRKQIRCLKSTGYDWNSGVDYHALFESYKYSGFQATNFGLAVDEINKMLATRKVPLKEDQTDSMEDDEFIRRKSSCTIFLGYTSNMASCGMRDTIRFLVQHKMVDCIVASAGGVEEDFIKCLAPTYLGDFHLEGKKLRERGINRIGNLLVPNDNYCKFEDWITPKLDAMLREQKEQGTLWTPSKVIARLGEEIDNPDSIYYWAAKNKIPVFSPALTDGSLGDMMYFHSFRNPGLVLDILSDLRRLNSMAMKAVNSGIIIVGGGVIKHHICNANLMRNGADYAVFVNTASEFDGSDSGARPDEAVSWGKIKKDATPVKIYAEASLIFPLLVGETFARQFHSSKERAVSDV